MVHHTVYQVNFSFGYQYPLITGSLPTPSQYPQRRPQRQLFVRKCMAAGTPADTVPAPAAETATTAATSLGCLRHFEYSKFRIFRMFFFVKMAQISRNYTKFFYANLHKILRFVSPIISYEDEIRPC
jgi:hypothetical protein